jgi:hypothetical protein
MKATQVRNQVTGIFPGQFDVTGHGLPLSLTLQTDLSDAMSYSKYSHTGLSRFRPANI